MTSTMATPSPSKAADIERRRAANRQNLRSHYGLASQRKSPNAATATTVSVGETGSVRSNGKEKQVEGDPLDIESPAFSAQAYYNHLMTTASLPQLVKASTSLTSDVKNLDSLRHSLVYNHHHQLFAAGDTISVLNSRTPELEEIVKSLQESFDEISTLVEAVQVPPKDDRSGGGGSMTKENGERMSALRKRVELMLAAGTAVDEVDMVFRERSKVLSSHGMADPEVRSFQEQIERLIEQARSS